MSAALKPFSVTLFSDFAASSKQLQQFTLEGLQDRILRTSAPAKARLPWLKLAHFGDIRSEQNSLRHNSNVLTVTGIEADYDGGTMPFEEAVTLVTEAGLRALVYTSPSHTPEAPRWRVLCPFSTELPPEERTRMLARLNGLFDGIFAGESWVLSQAYYFGAVNRNPAHQAVVIDGTPIDELDLLDGIAIGKGESNDLGKNEEPVEADQPASCIDEILQQKRIGIQIDIALQKVRNAADGEKHPILRDQATVIGGWLHHLGTSDSEAVRWLLDALDGRAEDEAAAKKTALCGIAKGRKKPLTLMERPNPYLGNRGGSRQPEPPPHPGQSDANRSAIPPQPGEIFEQIVWPEPLDILAASNLTVAPVLDASHVPDAIYGFCVDVARRLGVDQATVALTALASCASMISEDWKVQPKRLDYTWTEGARLWCAIVGDPGILKTPVITVCTKPIDKIDAQAREQHKLEMREWRTAAALAKADKQPEPPQPKLDRYLVADATIDALSEVLRDDDEAKQRAPLGKVLSRHDEMTEWLGGLDRYKAGGKGGSDRGAYLRLYNGGRHTIDRIGRGAFAIPSWSGGVIGGIQPAPFARIARETSDDGLFQRFLWAVPDGGQVGEDCAPDRLAIARYEALFPALLALQPGQPIGGGDPRALVLDDGAQQHRQDLDLQFRALAGTPDFDPRTKSALDKWPGVFPRLCLTFHLIEIADARARDEQPPVSDVIKAPIAAKVAAYMQQILLPHLLRAHAVMLNSEQTGHVAWVAGYILAHSLTTISIRDIVRSYRPLQAPEARRELQNVMESLTQIGWCDPVPSTNPAKGTISWQVNPAVHTRFAEQTARERTRREARKVAMAEAFAIRAAEKAKAD